MTIRISLPSLVLLLLAAGCATPQKTQSQGRTLVVAATKDAADGEFIGAFPKDRPVDLRPGAIPKRVRYKAVADQTVITAAESLRGALRNPEVDIFANSVLLFPGAWIYFKKVEGIGITDSKPMTHHGANGRAEEGRLLGDRNELARLHRHWVSTLKTTPAVHGLRTEEMAKWWIYIPFDIEEPVFVVDDTANARKYIVVFGRDGKILLLDELNHY